MPVFLFGFLFTGSLYYFLDKFLYLAPFSSELDLKNPHLILVDDDSFQINVKDQKSLQALDRIVFFYLKKSNVFKWKEFTIYSPEVVPIGYKNNSHYTFKYKDNWIKLLIYRDQDSNDIKNKKFTTPTCFLSWGIILAPDTSSLAQAQNIEDFVKQYIQGDAIPLIKAEGKKTAIPRPNYYCYKLNVDNLTWTSYDDQS